MKKNKERKMKFVGFKKLKDFLKKKSDNAQKASNLLIILILFSIITGGIGYYTFAPAHQMYLAQNNYEKAQRAVMDYSGKQRETQQKKADKALKVYEGTFDKYLQNDNILISSVAKIHSNIVKAVLAIIMLLPFIAISLMFIGHPVNFLFAIANLIIVNPCKAIKYLFNSLREKNPTNEKEEALALS